MAGLTLEQTRPLHAKFLARLAELPAEVPVRRLLEELMPEKETWKARERALERWQDNVPGFRAAYQELMIPRHEDFARRCNRVLELVEEGKTWRGAFAQANVSESAFLRRKNADPELARRWDAVRAARDFAYIDHLEGAVLRKSSEIEADGDDWRRGNVVLNAVRTRAAAAARSGRESPLEDFLDVRHVQQSGGSDGVKEVFAALGKIVDRLKPPPSPNPEQEKFEVVEVDPATGEWLGPPKELTT